MTRPFITNSFTNSTFSSNSAVVMSSLRTSRLQFFSAAGWVLREGDQQEGEEEEEKGEEVVGVDIERDESAGGGGGGWRGRVGGGGY